MKVGRPIDHRGCCTQCRPFLRARGVGEGIGEYDLN